MASIFFVRCKRENRRFSGAKSRFSRAADRNKDAASRAGELIRGSLKQDTEKQKYGGEEDTLLFCVKREAENLRLSP